MKKVKKGFTLIELLTVIILIGLLLGIGIPGISRISKNMKQKSLDTKINLIEQAAILYGESNKTLLQVDICKIDGKDYACNKTNIETLINNKYLEYDDYNLKNFNNPIDDKSMLNKCVYIYKKNNRVYSYYSKENYCTINPPILTTSDNKKSGESHEYPFYLTISTDYSEENYITKYKINNDEYINYTDKIAISENLTITAKTCLNDEPSQCSKEVKYNAVIQNEIGDITFTLNPAPTNGWNIDKVDITIEAQNAEKIEYSYIDEESFENYTSPISISEVTKGKILYAKATWGVIEKKSEQIVKIRKEIGDIKIEASDGLDSDESHIGEFYIELKAEHADIIEYQYGENTAWIKYNDKILISEPTSGKTLYVRAYQEGVLDSNGEINYKTSSYIVKMKGKLGEIYITPSDNIASSAWHNNRFTIELSADYADSIKYRYGTSGPFENYGNTPISINKETSSTTLHVKAYQDSTFKEKSYVVKYDSKAPEITKLTASYDTDNSIATLNLTAKDTSKISYYFSKLNSYDDSDLIQSNNTSLSTTYRAEKAENAEWFVFLKDEVGNVTTKSIKVSNCKPAYNDNLRNSCSGSGYNGKQTCKAELNMENSDTLSYKLKSSGKQTTISRSRTKEGELKPYYKYGADGKIESKVTDIACSNSRGCHLEIYTSASGTKTLCYREDESY